MKPIVTNNTTCYICIYRDHCKHFHSNYTHAKLLYGIGKHCKHFTYPIVKSGITEVTEQHYFGGFTPIN